MAVRIRLLLGALACLLALGSTAASAGSVERRLPVPYQSQLDGSPYAEANCGPATMAMVLAAFGKPVGTGRVRTVVNYLQGTWGEYDAGTFIENLGVVASWYGLRPLDELEGDGKTLRRWTLDEVRTHIDAGHPVVPQLWYRGIPGREDRAYNGDHYLVLTGYDGDDFIYNDPVDVDGPGANRRMSSAALDRAWRNSDFPYAAFAVAGPDARPSLTPTPHG